MKPSLRALSTLQKGRYGTYHLVSPDSALKAYPTPRAVPDHIPRPDYVPHNFFTAPWGEHDPPTVDPEAEVAGERIKLGSDEEIRVRKAGHLAGSILAKVKSLIKVGQR